MKLRSFYWLFAATFILLFTSCKITPQKAQRYLDQSNYERLYSFVSKEIQTGQAEISPYMGEERTAFEVSIFGLITTENPYQESVANLLTQNSGRILPKSFGMKFC